MAKSVEESFMIKNINARNLREGDWLYHDLKIGKKVIKASFEGLSKKDIELIQKHYKNKKKIVVKEGIPFVPVFLIIFILFLFLRNSSWELILRMLGF